MTFLYGSYGSIILAWWSYLRRDPDHTNVPEFILSGQCLLKYFMWLCSALIALWIRSYLRAILSFYMGRTVSQIQPRERHDQSVWPDHEVRTNSYRHCPQCSLFVFTVLLTLWGTCSWTVILALIGIQVAGTLWGASLFATQQIPQITTVCV